MKLNATIGEAQHSVEIREAAGKTVAVIDGDSYDVEVSNPEPNVFLIKKNGKVYEAFVSPNSDVVSINGHDIEVSLSDPKKLRGAGKAGADAEGKADIKTAMPGKIVRILAESGATVEKGEGILVVEAMKMQNELKAPKDGTVTDIRVAEGDTVAAGDVLATIE
jgi:biotin carboxyl carrier protein